MTERDEHLLKRYLQKFKASGSKKELANRLMDYLDSSVVFSVDNFEKTPRSIKYALLQPLTGIFREFHAAESLCSLNGLK